MNRAFFSRSWLALAGAALVGTGLAFGQPAFRMEVGLSDEDGLNPATGYSSLVGGGGALTAGFYYQGKEVGAVLPLSVDPTRSFLDLLGIEVFLVNPKSNIGISYRLYDVGVNGVPTGSPLFAFDINGLSLPDGASEILIEQIAFALPNGTDIDLNGKSEVALTVLFTGLNPGEGGLSIAGSGGLAIEREPAPTGAPEGEFFTIGVVVPETSTVAAGALMALACGGLYLKRRRS